MVNNLKITGSEKPLISAAQLINDALDVYPSLIPIMKKIKILIKTINLHRSKDRPKDPTDLNFELDNNLLSASFLKKDFIINNKQHIIFMTDTILNTIRTARTWYLDGTFRIMTKIFYQLHWSASFLLSRVS